MCASVLCYELFLCIPLSPLYCNQQQSNTAGTYIDRFVYVNMQFAFSVNDAHVHVCYSYNNKVIDMINLLGWLSIVCPILYIYDNRIEDLWEADMEGLDKWVTCMSHMTTDQQLF